MSPSAMPLATTSGWQVDLLEVARPVAVEHLHDRDGTGGGTAGSVLQSKASTETTRASGYSVPGGSWTSAACCAFVGSSDGQSTNRPSRVARPTGTRSSSISQTARRRRLRASGLGGGASGSGPWLWEWEEEGGTRPG